MSKRNSTALSLLVVVAVVVAGFMIFHKSPKSPSTASSSSNNAPAVNNAVVITKSSPGLGQYLTDPNGRALYTFGGDSSGVSNCTGSCLSTWPGYYVPSSSASLPANIGTITRSDNNHVQYTYNGMPLYYFASDSAGQATGNGVDNFTLAKPAAASPQPAATTPPPSSSTNSNPYNY